MTALPCGAVQEPSCVGVAEMWGWELAGWHSLPLEAAFLHLRILWERLSSICAPLGLGHVVSLERDEVVG